MPGMEELRRIEALIDYAKSFRGVPYKYGGRNRLEGIDCSQFVLELLIRQGLWPHGKDGSAQDIFNHFSTVPTDGGIFPAAGALAFYGKDSESIHHIAFCFDEFTMIEAGGGDKDTINFPRAVERSACVRERPIKYRKDFFCCLMPKYG